MCLTHCVVLGVSLFVCVLDTYLGVSVSLCVNVCLTHSDIVLFWGVSLCVLDTLCCFGCEYVSLCECVLDTLLFGV